MEPQVDRLVEKTWSRLQSLPATDRLLIAISGIPGSGKSVLAAAVTRRINARWHALGEGKEDIATFVPMDGFHYTRAYLSAMPDPQLAFDRRGAHWTFDSAAFLQLVKTVRVAIAADSGTTFAPSFSHPIKDPVENDIAISPRSRIVVFEGNYLSLDLPPWNEAAKLMDELWFVDVDLELARRRLIDRHLQSGIVKDKDEARRRVDGNDFPNGEEIIKRRLEVQEVVKSVEDEEWVRESLAS